MIIFAVDPGPTTSGMVVYDSTMRRVVLARSASSLDDVLCELPQRRHELDIVAIERIQAQGIAGASVIETARVVGRIEQRARDQFGPDVVLLYRHEVLRELDVSGARRDVLVRERMIEAHPGGVGTKQAPGPLHGVSGHAWQALGLAVAVARRYEREGMR